MVSAYDEAQMRSQYPSVSSPSRTSSFTSLPPGASPPIPSPNAPRSPSPFSTSTNASVPTTKIHHPRDRDNHPQQTIRKKPPPNAPVALGILRALDPPTAGVAGHLTKANSEERFVTQSESGHQGRERDRERDPLEKKEKKGFWNRDKEKEKDRDKERERERERMFERERERGRHDENPAELTRMIGTMRCHVNDIGSLIGEKFILRLSYRNCRRRLGCCIRSLRQGVCKRKQC